MKKILCKVCCFIESLGYAHAASVLAREGYHEEAKRLALMEKPCKC